MKNLCPDIEFDGVYFQKMYAVNILEAVEKKKQKENDEDLENSDPKAEEPEEEVFSQTDIIDDFAAIIRMWTEHVSFHWNQFKVFILHTVFERNKLNGFQSLATFIFIKNIENDIKLKANQ